MKTRLWNDACVSESRPLRIRHHPQPLPITMHTHDGHRHKHRETATPIRSLQQHLLMVSIDKLGSRCTSLGSFVRCLTTCPLHHVGEACGQDYPKLYIERERLLPQLTPHRLCSKHQCAPEGE